MSRLENLRHTRRRPSFIQYKLGPADYLNMSRLDLMKCLPATHRLYDRADDFGVLKDTRPPDIQREMLTEKEVRDFKARRRSGYDPDNVRDRAQESKLMQMQRFADDIVGEGDNDDVVGGIELEEGEIAEVVASSEHDGDDDGRDLTASTRALEEMNEQLAIRNAEMRRLLHTPPVQRQKSRETTGYILASPPSPPESEKGESSDTDSDDSAKAVCGDDSGDEEDVRNDTEVRSSAGDDNIWTENLDPRLKDPVMTTTIEESNRDKAK